ncbi:MAG: acetate--CoA ligase family protein [Candidatus Methanoglobus sp.]
MLLLEQEAKELLEGYGIRTAKGVVCGSEEEAVRAARAMGFPVVMKVHGILHKSDVGGVVLNVKSEEEVRSAFRRLSAIEGSRGVNVQPQVSGVELIIGAAENEQFGSFVMFGLGGVFVEVLKDVSFRLLPLDKREALEMIREIRGYRILEGYRGFRADVDAVAELIVKVGEIVERESVVEMDLNPVFANERGCFVADARIVKGKRRSFEYAARDIGFFFNPRSVAVVGASRTPGKPGNNIIWNLKTHGFKGKIYPVNPNAEEIHDLKCYPSLKDIPDSVDVAIIAVPAKIVPEVMRDCAEKGVKGVVILSSGFSEEGEEGAKIEKEVVRIAKEAGILILGPNTTGGLNTETGFITSFAPLMGVNKGNISLIAQTGLFLGVLMVSIFSNHPHVGFSKIIGMGNKIDVQDHEALDFLLRDDKTSVVGIYMEGIRNGRAFYNVAKSAKKPIVIFKSGRTEYGQKAAMSHTASICGNDDIFDAVCRQANLVRVYSFDELLDVAKAFAFQPLPKGNRVGIIHYTGSGCVQSADTAFFSGLKLANFKKDTVERIKSVSPEWHGVNNPVDIWPMVEYFGVEKTYNTAMEAILRDENVDSMVVAMDVGPFWGDYSPNFEKLRSFGKPVYFVLEGHRDLVFEQKNKFEENRFPVYSNAINAIQVLGKVTKYALKYADTRR